MKHKQQRCDILAIEARAALHRVIEENERMKISREFREAHAQRREQALQRFNALRKYLRPRKATRATNTAAK